MDTKHENTETPCGELPHEACFEEASAALDHYPREDEDGIIARLRFLCEQGKNVDACARLASERFGKEPAAAKHGCSLKGATERNREWRYNACDQWWRATIEEPRNTTPLERACRLEAFHNSSCGELIFRSRGPLAGANYRGATLVRPSFRLLATHCIIDDDTHPVVASTVGEAFADHHEAVTQCLLDVVDDIHVRWEQSDESLLSVSFEGASADTEICLRNAVRAAKTRVQATCLGTLPGRDKRASWLQSSR